jgi:ribosomal protein L7/L12
MLAVLEFSDYAGILAIAVFAAASGLSVYLKPTERARLTRLEAKVDLLLKQAGLAYDPKAAVPPGVLDALLRGNKIEAIKLYREATGVGLAEAKAFVEELQASPKG